MAKNKDKRKNGNDGAKGGKMSRFRALLTLFFAVVAAIVFLPSTIVFVITMLPTFVAVIVDKSPQKAATLTVGALNLAGMIPAWLRLWQNGQTIEIALDVATNHMVLIIAYGAAGFGWVIYQNVTPFVSGIIVRRTEKRVRQIETRLQAMREKWGPEIAGPSRELAGRDGQNSANT